MRQKTQPLIRVDLLRDQPTVEPGRQDPMERLRNMVTPVTFSVRVTSRTNHRKYLSTFSMLIPEAESVDYQA
jgi:hypothetical protein